MPERMFDESHNIREALDDVIEKATVREKLIQLAKQFGEKKKEEKYALALRQFENLMGDFLRLYHPMFDRIRSYRESLQKETTSLRTAFMTVTGMLDVTRGIDTLAGKVKELEADAIGLDNAIKEKTKVIDKIDDLLNRLKPHLTAVPSSERESLSDVLGGMSKDLFLDMPDTGKESEPTRKSASR